MKTPSYPKILLSVLPDILLFLAVILIPWQARWIYGVALIDHSPYEYGMMSVYLGSIVLVIALAVHAIPKLDTKVVVGAGALLLWLLLRATPASALGLNFLGLMVIAAGYVLLAHGVSHRKLLYALITGGVVQAVIAWWQFAAQVIHASTILGVAFHDPSRLGDSVVIIDTMRYLRAYGLLPHPNMLAGYLALAGAACLVVLAEARMKEHIGLRTVFLGALFVIASGLLLTFSRAGIIALALFSLISMYLLIRKGHRQQQLIVGRAVVSLVVMFFAANIMFGNVYLQRFHVASNATAETTRLETISDTERFGGYYEAAQLLDPTTVLVGVGLNHYVPSLARVVPGKPIYSYQPVHNIFLLALIEIGLVGCILLGYFIFVIFKKTLYGRKDMEHYLLFSMIGMLLVLGLADHYLWSSYFGQSLWWLTVGLAVSKK